MAAIGRESGGRVLLAILTVLSVSIAAHSADQEGEISDFDDFDQLYLGELLNTVFTAAKHEQDITEAPSAITVITRKDIETSGARTLPEALRVVPNMDVYMVKPLWYAVGLRGGTSQASDSLLLLVDGRDVTLEFLGAPIWTIQHFSMDEVERIEVIRGPGSALYGANAYAGVVHVITRSPGGGPTAAASVMGGERGVSEVACRGTTRLGPVALSADAGIVREDLWTGRDVTARDVIRGRIQGQVELGSVGKLNLDAGAYQGQGYIPSDLGAVDLHDAVDLYGRLRFERGELIAQAAYNRVSLAGDIDMRLYYSALKMELAKAPPIEGYFDKVGVQAQHGVELFHNRLTYGAEWVYNGYHVDNYVDPDQDEHRAGLFLQDELDLSAIVNDLAESEMPPLALTAGLRFDYNSITDWELSPRATLVFRPGKNHSIRAGYAHAFLKPTFFESSLRMNLIEVNDMGFTNLNVGNPDLKNQTIDSVELGYGAYFFDRRLLVQIDLAYNWYRNTIGFYFDPDEMEYKNIGGVLIPDLNSEGLMGHRNRKKGSNGHNVEVQLTTRPVDNLRLFLTAGYRQIFGVESRKIHRSEPVLRFAAGADLRGDADWTVSLRAFYTGGFSRSIGNPDSVLEPQINKEINPAFFVNARFAWTLVDGPWKFSAGLEVFNLLGNGFREMTGLPYPNDPDAGGELLGRRIVLFVRGEI